MMAAAARPDSDLPEGLSEFRPLVSRLRRQLGESQRHETVLVARLAEREDQLAAALREIDGYRRQPSVQALQRAFLDPSVGLLYTQLRRRLLASEKLVEKLRDDLAAAGGASSDPNNIVNRLKSRCRQLIAENEELGNQLAEGRTEQLERSLVAERKVSAALRRVVDDKDAMKLTAQLMEELETLQSDHTVLQNSAAQAQRDLAEAQRRIRELEARLADGAAVKRARPDESDAAALV